MGGEPDAETARAAELSTSARYSLDRLLPKAREPAARVGDVQEHELDPRCLGRLGRRERLGDAEIVELADRRVAGGAHLAVASLVRRAHELRRLPLGLREHRLAPRPEVAAGRAPAQRALERVAVGVDEPGQCERARHERRRYQGPA